MASRSQLSSNFQRPRYVTSYQHTLTESNTTFVVEFLFVFTGGFCIPKNARVKAGSRVCYLCICKHAYMSSDMHACVYASVCVYACTHYA